MEIFSKDVFLSVILPTCNRGEDLARCLKALEPQGVETTSTGPGGGGVKRDGFLYEVIVSDDGIGAEALIRTNFPWATYFQGPRRGPAANRNFGATQANGTWLLFLDDDCVPGPGWLEAYAVGINRFSESSVFEGKTVAPGPKLRADHESPLNLTGGLLWSCNFGVKRQLFLQLGGFDENFPFPAMEDMDLQLRLSELGYTSIFLSEACVEHPWRPKRGTRFCIEAAKSVGYYTTKHPETRATFIKTWRIKRMIKILFFEFPRNLLAFPDISSFRVLYLDLLTSVLFSFTLATQRDQGRKHVSSAGNSLPLD
jgi:GT2 family glycosyltransferase